MEDDETEPPMSEEEEEEEEEEQQCWSVCAVRSSCGIIAISSSASVDAASNETNLFCRETQAHRSTLQFQTSRSRCAYLCVIKLAEYAHMMFMYTQYDVQTLRCITWHYRTGYSCTVTRVPSQETDYCLLCGPSVSTDSVCCMLIRLCKPSDDCSAGCCC